MKHSLFWLVSFITWWQDCGRPKKLRTQCQNCPLSNLINVDRINDNYDVVTVILRVSAGPVLPSQNENWFRDNPLSFRIRLDTRTEYLTHIDLGKTKIMYTFYAYLWKNSKSYSEHACDNTVRIDQMSGTLIYGHVCAKRFWIKRFPNIFVNIFIYRYSRNYAFMRLSSSARTKMI